MTPFLGQGTPPEGGIDVYVTVALDRLLEVDCENYRFQAVFFVLLTWVDPQASALIDAANAAFKANGTCSLPCTSMYNPDSADDACCGTNVWLPHLEFMNVAGFSQDRVVRYAIRQGENNSIAWWAHVQGDFYTNFDFRAFPFDTQRLVIQVAYSDKKPENPVNFIPSSVAISTFNPQRGDDISGWTVNAVEMKPYAVVEDYLLTLTSPSNPNDPFPIHPVDANSTNRFVSYLWRKGFSLIITVHRVSLYFVLTAIIPIALNVWLALLVFSVAPKHLDTRLGIIVTLFLSLTALMLVVGGSLPQSSIVVPTQQLCLLSYFVLGFIGLESIMIYKIVTVERQKNIKTRTTHARQQFLHRWDAMKTSRHGGAPTTTTTKSSSSRYKSCWPRRRRKRSGEGQQQQSPPNGIVVVDVPQFVDEAHDQQNDPPVPSSTTAPPAAAAAVNGDGDKQPNADAGPVLDHRQSTMDYLPMGGLHHSESSDEPAFGAASDGSSFESSNAARCRRGMDAQGQQQQQGNVASRQMHKTKAIWAEMNRSADYSLHIALKIDNALFWCILITYNVALIIILVININYEPALKGTKV